MAYEFATKATDYDLLDGRILELLDEHHAKLRFASFSPDVGFQLGLALREEFLGKYGDESIGRPTQKGVKAGLGAVITIRLFDGQQLFTCVVGKPGATTADNWTWVNGKEAVVKRTGKASFLMGRLFDAQGRKPEDKGFPFPQYACHGGGYPIWLKNNSTGPIGTILVSGLPQAEDHQLIVDTLVKFLPTLDK